MFLIIKSMFKIHVFFYLVMVIAFVTGNIRDYLIFTSIIIVHELGHIVGGVLFSWNIYRVIILPFGGLTIFNIPINTSLFEQFIVTFLGPFFQVCFYFFINYFFCLSSSVKYYNFILLFFNLIPIFPLDGSKFLYQFLCIFFPFKYCHLIIVFISFFCIFLVLFLLGGFDFLIYLILLFLFIQNVKELLNHRVLFYKFLFEKYNYGYRFKRLKIVEDVRHMFLCSRHLFFIDGIYDTELNYLVKMFDNRMNL